jgi:hypothetical protein
VGELIMPHNNKEYIEEAMSEVRVGLSKLENLERENEGWFGRIDSVIDDIAHRLDLVIPYTGFVGYGRGDKARYNAAYRLEILRDKIKEREEQMNHIVEEALEENIMEQLDEIMEKVYSIRVSVKEGDTKVAQNKRSEMASHVAYVQQLIESLEA